MPAINCDAWARFAREKSMWLMGSLETAEVATSSPIKVPIKLLSEAGILATVRAKTKPISWAK